VKTTNAYIVGCWL